MMAMARASINNKTAGCFFGNPATDGILLGVWVCVFCNSEQKGLRTTREFHVTQTF